jgi:alkylation response protein AidB-like acyl-CoA dehydrogenase
MAVLSEEQSMLRDAAKSWVQEKSPVTAFRKMRDSGVELGYDANAWNEMAEMGWAGVIIPEEFGGSNFGYLSMGLILEELGRTLTASPLLASGLGAASALVLGGSDEQKSNWLPKIASGEVVGALAVDEGAHHAPEKVALKAEKSGDGYTLNGTKSFVLEGLAANLYIVSARTSGNPGDTKGITLFVVPADAAGISKKRLSLAAPRLSANVTFENVKVGADAVLGEVDNGYPLLEKVLDRARAGLAAEMLGSATQAFETTLEYLKTRVQFGQVIGSFQALQHRPRAVPLGCRSRLAGDRQRHPGRARAGEPGQGQDGRHLPPDLQRDGADARRYRHDRRPRRRLLPEARPGRGSRFRQPSLPPRPLRADPRLLRPAPAGPAPAATDLKAPPAHAGGAFSLAVRRASFAPARRPAGRGPAPASRAATHRRFRP